MDRKTGSFFSAADFLKEHEYENFSPSQARFFFGPNLIELENRSVLRLFLDELVHPFNVFQLASVAIWCLEQYYLYAFTIFVISATSTAITLKETHENDCKLRSLSRFQCKVRLTDDSDASAQELDSTELVPGHQVQLDGIEVCPADLVLLEGDAIVDESMLTGESVPVCKTPGSHLYAGTKILRARHAKAAVHKTGFLTLKGQLLLSILFPKPITLSFYSDSLKYIYMLAVLAGVGFAFSLYSQLKLGMSFYYIATRALDLITVVLPPALPATLSIGTMFALQRLRKPHQIHCISPSKINVASKIEVVCFDKTGTLTEDGLQLFRTIPSSSENGISLEHCMALCHSLQTIDGILVGDPLDKIMFESTGWSLQENQANSLLRAMLTGPPTSESVSSSVGIFKCFDFCAGLRRMSVIGRLMGNKQQLTVAYCKGSPESILECCRSDSIPVDFQSTMDFYSRAGFRVIACAGRVLSQNAWAHQLLHREEVERDLHFLGFLVFENRLKTASPPVIAELAEAGIPSLMVTGDNLFTAVCVARSCGIVKDGQRVLMFVNDSRQLQCIQSDELIETSELILQSEKTVVACTGADLSLLMAKQEPAALKAILSRIRVFARMSPEDKKTLVSLIQDGLGLTVGFCGDGANDCGALKAADIGISLSDSEASVAAPFASVCKDVSCVLTVLKEGRAALSTSFAAFKFMALYSMIQFTSLLLLYSRGSSLGDNQFVLIDLLLILPLGALMSRFEPAERLCLGNPETKLVSPSVLSSLLGQITLQIFAQAYIYFEASDGKVNPIIDDHPVILGQANTAVFLFSLFVYLAGAVLFSSWRPFRKFYAPFYGYAGVMLALSFVLIWVAGGNDFLSWLLELVSINAALKVKIVVVAVLYWIVSFLFEYLIFYFKARV